MQSRNSASRRETPPLTRGRLLWRGEITDYEGNTPAYAGKTDPQGKTCRRDWKHPRLRGEDRQARRILEWQMETPPLTRGRPSCAARAHRPDRNTPAYAGKTGRHEDDRAPARKHPRLRGEDPEAGEERGGLLETPPLTRGRLRVLRAHRRARGNTPAYAGKTGPRSRGAASSEKHPRLRGEDVRRPNDQGRTEGNTPAYAGKTNRYDKKRKADRKHPRLRGEDP